MSSAKKPGSSPPPSPPTRPEYWLGPERLSASEIASLRQEMHDQYAEIDEVLAAQKAARTLN